MLDGKFLGEGAPGGAGVHGALGLGVELRPYRLLVFGVEGHVSVVGKTIEKGDSET